MRSLYFLLTCIGLLQTPLAYANLSLLQARQQAYALDPELQALSSLQSVDLLRITQAGRLTNPELSVELDNLGQSSDAASDGVSMEWRYSQALPLNNKRDLRVSLAQVEQLKTQLTIQKRTAELASDVRLCLARWTMAQSRVSLQQDEQSVAQSQVRLLSERLRAGKIVPSEYQRAVALAQEADAQVQGQQQITLSIRAECEVLIGTLPDQPIILTTTPPVLDQQMSLSQQQAELEIAQAKANVALATAERRPDVTMSVGTRRSQNNQDQVWLLAASMPLTLFDQNQVARAQSQQQLNQAVQMSTLTQQRTLLRIQQAQTQHLAAQQQLAVLQQQVLPAATESLRIAQLAYQAGKTGLLEWLEARQVWRAARERQVSNELALQQAIANLEREFPVSPAMTSGLQP